MDHSYHSVEDTGSPYHSGHDTGSMSAIGDSSTVAADGSTAAAPAPFCTGSTAMYMSGFRFALASGNGSHPCLNLFFESWTLDSPAKFVFGVLFVYILATMTEGLSALRRGVRRWMGPGLQRKALSVATHALQATLGYALMLAAMTYAAEMFLAVVSGMATGYALFFDDVGRVKGMAMADLGGGGGKTAADHCLVDDAVDDSDVGEGGRETSGECFSGMQVVEGSSMGDGFIQDLSSGMGSGRTFHASNKKGS